MHDQLVYLHFLHKQAKMEENINSPYSWENQIYYIKNNIYYMYNTYITFILIINMNIDLLNKYIQLTI